MEPGARSELRSTGRRCPRSLQSPPPPARTGPQKSLSSRGPSSPIWYPRAPPPPATVTPKKLTPNTSDPALGEPPRKPPGRGRDPSSPASPSPGSPGRRGLGRRRAWDTHRTIESRAGGARLPGPRLLPAWESRSLCCPSGASPPPHPPPPPLLARHSARRRRGRPGSWGLRSWRRRSGRRALMARGGRCSGDAARRRERGAAGPSAMRRCGGGARRRSRSSGGGRGGLRTGEPRAAGSGTVAGRTWLFHSRAGAPRGHCTQCQ